MFSSTVNLSNNLGNSVTPSIAASGNNVYVVWADSTPGNNEILYRRSTSGGAMFSSTVNLSNNLGNSVTPSIAASGNNVYVVWADSTPGNNEILYRRSTSSGAMFINTVNLSNNSGSSFRPSIAASGNNNVHVVWFDRTTGNYDILYRRSTSGGAMFINTVNLSNNSGSSFRPSIAASGNNVYVVWQDLTPANNEIFYRRSVNGGANFGGTTNLSSNAGNSINPYISASGNNVYITWTDSTPGNNEILYRRSLNVGVSFSSTISS